MSRFRAKLRNLLVSYHPPSLRAQYCPYQENSCTLRCRHLLLFGTILWSLLSGIQPRRRTKVTNFSYSPRILKKIRRNPVAASQNLMLAFLRCNTTSDPCFCYFPSSSLFFSGQLLLLDGRLTRARGFASLRIFRKSLSNVIHVNGTRMSTPIFVRYVRYLFFYF